MSKTSDVISQQMTVNASVTLEKLKIFRVLPLKNIHDEQEGTGDVDFLISLTSHDNQLENTQKSHYIRKAESEVAVYHYIENTIHHSCDKPILHIFINEPRTTALFTNEGLKKFKEKGGIVVVTLIEFYKYPIEHNIHRENMLLQLEEAQHVVFLDDVDRKSALSFATASPKFQNNIKLRQKLDSASIIGIPPTVRPKMLNTLKKGKNIAVTGMIRPWKGYVHLIQFAKLWQKENPAALKDSKIFVAGTIQEHESNNKEFHKLMEAIYPAQSIHINTLNICDLKKLLLDNKLKNIAPALPIEILFDLTEEQLSQLHEQCEFVLLLGTRGASTRLSSFTTAIAHQTAIITLRSSITDECLLPGGEYHGAFIFANAKNPHQRHTSDLIAREVLNIMVERITQPILNQKTLEISNRLFENVLHPDIVSKKYAILYNYLNNPNDPASQPIRHSSKFDAREIKLHSEFETCTDKGIKTFRHQNELINFSKTLFNRNLFKKYLLTFRNEVQLQHTSRAFEFTAKLPLKQTRDNDFLRTKCLQNLKNLRIFLGQQGGQHKDNLPPKMTTTLKRLRNSKNKKKSTKPTLPPPCVALETAFIRKALQLPWVAQSVTNSKTEILNSYGLVMSQAIRGKRSQPIQSSHTSRVENHRNTNFLSFSVGEDALTSSHFKDYTSVIKFRNNLPSYLSHGQWISDHIYYYHFEHASMNDPMKLFGCTYWVTYKKKFDAKSGKTLFIKYRHFIHPDGSYFRNETLKGDEFFIGPNIEMAIMLLVIKIVRYMGPEVWRKIMNLDEKNIQELIQLLIHPHYLELHKPGSYSIFEPGISMTSRPLYNKVNIDISAFNVAMNQILEGKIDPILKWIKAGGNVNALLNTKIGDINILGLAIITNNLKLVQSLLKLGVRLDVGNTIELNDQKHCFSPISLSLLASQPEKVQPLLNKLIEKSDLKVNDESAKLILASLFTEGTNYKTQENFRSLCPITVEEILYVVVNLKCSADIIFYILSECVYSKTLNFHLCLGVLLRSIPITKLLIQRGAQIDEVLLSGDYSFKQGLTSFIVAVCQNDFAMTEFLISCGADINKPFCSAPLGKTITAIHPYEGMTPLMIAISQNNIEIIKLLLKNGAHVFIKNIRGDSAVSLAKKSKNNKIIELFKKYDTDLPPIFMDKNHYLPPEIAFMQKTHYYVMLGRTIDKRRFFVLFNNVSLKNPCDLPFDCATLNRLPREWLQKASNNFDLDLAPGKIQYHEVTFSTTIAADAVHYQTTITLCDMGDCDNTLIEKFCINDDALKLLYASDVLNSTRFKINFPLLELEHSNIVFPPFSAQLLHSLSRAESFNNLPCDELTLIHNIHYQSQHKFFDCARKGDIKTLTALLNTSLISINHILPQIQAGENQSTHLLQNALYLAILNKHFECAVFLMRNGANLDNLLPASHAVLEKLFRSNSEMAIEIINQRGHALFIMLHSKKVIQDDYRILHAIFFDIYDELILYFKNLFLNGNYPKVEFQKAIQHALDIGSWEFMENYHYLSFENIEYYSEFIIAVLNHYIENGKLFLKMNLFKNQESMKKFMTTISSVVIGKLASEKFYIMLTEYAISRNHIYLIDSFTKHLKPDVIMDIFKRNEIHKRPEYSQLIQHMSLEIRQICHKIAERSTLRNTYHLQLQALADADDPFQPEKPTF